MIYKIIAQDYSSIVINYIPFLPLSTRYIYSSTSSTIILLGAGNLVLPSTKHPVLSNPTLGLPWLS